METILKNAGANSHSNRALLRAPRESATEKCSWRRLHSLLASQLSGTHANGIDGNGVGARSMGMAGADVAWAADPLSAMGLNPAVGLGFLGGPELDLGGVASVVQGKFNKPGVSSGTFGSVPRRGCPRGAFALPLPKWPVTLGLSFVPDSALVADWHYLDPPGGLGGVSYGYQQDKSEIIVLRSALGVGVQVNPKLSIGASAGMVYNQGR